MVILMESGTTGKLATKESGNCEPGKVIEDSASDTKSSP